MNEFTLRPSKGLSTEFVKYGNCAGTDPDLFFPERGDQEGVAAAKEVCRGCEVSDECLEYALTPPFERFGIWGGFSEQERRPMRVARNATTLDRSA